jgi:glycine cleavage system regulatory protein
MTGKFIVSFMGDATPTDIHKLARITHENGGQWLSSKIHYLDNRVAALIQIEAPTETEKMIQQAFLSHPNISAMITECEHHTKQQESEFQLRINARDRTGIINEITHLLDSQRIRVLGMNCQRIFIANTRGVNSALFIAHISLRLPELISIHDLVNELESLSEETTVIIENID